MSLCEAGVNGRAGEADQLFEKWMEETGTKQCPQCRMAVTKQNLERQRTQYQECHKMSPGLSRF